MYITFTAMKSFISNTLNVCSNIFILLRGYVQNKHKFVENNVNDHDKLI
jgi:hypothetical protein